MSIKGTATEMAFREMGSQLARYEKMNNLLNNEIEAQYKLIKLQTEEIARLKGNMQIPSQKCNRCGHEWILRKIIITKRCPKCHSANWNKERESTLQGEHKRYLQEAVYDGGISAIETQVSCDESLRKVMSKVLEQREFKVLELRFGLDGGGRRTLKEVGQEFNVTRERIRQIETKALRKLRKTNRELGSLN